MKHSPIKRTSPLKRKTKLRARSSTVAKNRAFREAVLERDDYVCQMLRDANGVGSYYENKDFFMPCRAVATDASHLLKRDTCGVAKYDPAVGIASCRRCHERWHAHDPQVRFPDYAIQRAEKAIAAAGNKTRPR